MKPIVLHNPQADRGGVTATVTSGAVRPLATGKAVAGGSDEVGHIRLRGEVVMVESDVARAFITDCARNIEGLKSDKELQESWNLDERAWAALAENNPLLMAIKAERERRIRNGEAPREAAQQHFATAPTILNEILQNGAISPRHRIEAAKELRQVASRGPEIAGAAGEKFIISIDLGEDCRLVKEFDLPARIHSDDGRCNERQSVSIHP
jgi:hypothetical protein